MSEPDIKRMTPLDFAQLAREHLGPAEVSEVLQAALHNTERFTVALNHHCAGRVMEGHEVARALLAAARDCARGGDA